MPLSAANLVHSSFLTQAEYHAETLTGLIGYTIGALEEATAEGDERVSLDDLIAELRRLRSRATVGQWDFSCLSALKDTIVKTRFVRLGDDLPDTDNPMYNVTIWLADAIGNAGALARLRTTCESTAAMAQAEA